MLGWVRNLEKGFMMLWLFLKYGGKEIKFGLVIVIVWYFLWYLIFLCLNMIIFLYDNLKWGKYVLNVYILLNDVYMYW